MKSKKRSQRKPEPISTVHHADHDVLHIPNELGERSLVLASKDSDEAIIKQAEQALADMSVHFVEWMDSEAARLDIAFKAFRNNGDVEDFRGALYRAAHDIRGEAATFGFPVAASMADNLCEVMDSIEELITGPAIDLVDAHVNAIHAVVRERVRSLDNPLAQVLNDELRTARQTVETLRKAK